MIRPIGGTRLSQPNATRLRLGRRTTRRRRSRWLVILLLAVAMPTVGCGGGTAADEGARSLPDPTVSSLPAPDPTTAPPPDPVTTPSTPLDETTESVTTTAPPTTAKRTTAPPKRKAGPRLGQYQARLVGTVGGRDFERTATVYVVETVASVGTTNGVNPVDVCVVSGFPGARPEVGAIWFGSNSGCNPEMGAADFDLAYVQTSGSSVTIRPDDRIAATLANTFTQSAGLAACPYTPVSGEMTVRTGAGDTITGSIDIVGYGCGSVSYRARISG